MQRWRRWEVLEERGMDKGGMGEKERRDQGGDERRDCGGFSLKVRWLKRQICPAAPGGAGSEP